MNKIQLSALIIATILASSLATAFVLNEITPKVLSQTSRDAKFIAVNHYEFMNGKIVEKWELTPTFAGDIPSGSSIEFYPDNRVNIVAKQLSINGVPIQ